jgi:CheY-like chemotaxis protein
VVRPLLLQGLGTVVAYVIRTISETTLLPGLQSKEAMGMESKESMERDGEPNKLNMVDEQEEITTRFDPAKPTILIVEDEAGPRAAYKVILRPFYNLYLAESAEDATDMLRDHKIDLVILDLKLSGRHGMEFLKDMKRENEDVEVVIITGYGTLQSAMDGIRFGAACHLLKPFDVMELITAINQALKRSKKGVARQFS